MDVLAGQLREEHPQEPSTTRPQAINLNIASSKVTGVERYVTPIDATNRTCLGRTLANRSPSLLNVTNVWETIPNHPV